jgi:hypothetical protein
MCNETYVGRPSFELRTTFCGITAYIFLGAIKVISILNKMFSILNKMFSILTELFSII